MIAAETLALVQASYFIASGAWPLVHLRSFELVTGPKRDDWLVHTVGVLVIAIGAALAAGVVDGVDLGDRVLAIGSALGLALIDVVYVARNVIRPVYLADAAVEAALIGAWLAV